MEECGQPDECYRSSNHAPRMMTKMESYYSKRQLCDVVLVVGAKRISAHRVLLSAASDYFAAMFTSDVSEAAQEEVKIHDVDPVAMEMLVQYMYTGEIPLHEDSVECLLSTSCLLQLSEVTEACCNFLMRQLHPSNCIGIRQFADAQGCVDLYKVAHNYVMEHFMEVVKQQEFCLLPPSELGILFASEDVNVANEEAMFHALITWAQHDTTARKPHLAELLEHIRLPLLSAQFLADHVETNTLFREDAACRELIMEALKYHILPERRLSLQNNRTKPRKATVGRLYAVGGMDCTKGQLGLS